ncbi:hypothetical protein HOY80DRAFT_956418 [Tuber brumale]|nr:hypothetical protein HOY80DRAFT_956418 [Tuber brumale]
MDAVPCRPYSPCPGHLGTLNSTSTKESTASLPPPITSMASSKTTRPSTRLPISDIEAKHYYYRLYSKPVLVARTGNDYCEQFRGPEAYLWPKELKTIGNHNLKGAWEDKLDYQIHNILESKKVM